SLTLGKTQRLFSAETADRLTHMLADAALRRRAFGKRNFMDFPFPVAEKTGTSKDYRDGWIAGFTPQFVAAVWVGNS
ncbi:penicillin-binding protein, partial [Xanthomonas citri pv. citri]|nr:penicillin-binding protein [Xanthomonas citri pv. citri]